MLPVGTHYKINGQDFYFSVAETGLELMNGLKGVESFGDFDGMLFDFGCSFSPIMTPSGLQFSVDVAFVLETGKIVEIARLDPALGLNLSIGREDIYYVLEVPVGFFETNNIQVGDEIKL